MSGERKELADVLADMDKRIGAAERRGSSPPAWLFLGVVLGAGIVGCCWLLSLRAVREAPPPIVPPAPAISCDCGTVTLVNPQDWARVLFDPTGDTSADGELVTLERLP
jgi:hypothetical protein